MKSTNHPAITELAVDKRMQRRNFLKFIGGTASVMAVAAACKKNDNPNPGGNGGIPLGSGDIGILNYAYALEQ